MSDTSTPGGTEKEAGKTSPEDIDKALTELPEGSPAPSLEKYNALLRKFNEVSTRSDERLRVIEELNCRISTLERTVNTNQILDGLIQPMSKKIFAFMCSYCGFVGFLVAAIFFSGKAFPVQALDFLVGTTAVTVIGLVGTIVTGIFAGARRSRN